MDPDEATTNTHANMNDTTLPKGLKRGSTSAGTRRAPLSMSSKRPLLSSRGDQSPYATSAPPPHRAQRTVSEPVPRQSFAQREVASMPMSAGYTERNLMFEREDQRLEKMRRRHSQEQKVNIYTECGRHSDEWLFGGFSVSDAVKRIWDRDRKV